MDLECIMRDLLIDVLFINFWKNFLNVHRISTGEDNRKHYFGRLVRCLGFISTVYARVALRVASIGYYLFDHTRVVCWLLCGLPAHKWCATFWSKRTLILQCTSSSPWQCIVSDFILSFLLNLAHVCSILAHNMFSEFNLWHYLLTVHAWVRIWLCTCC